MIKPIPYASAFMASPAWPMYMASYMPRPLTQPPFMQAQFEEFARQHQDIEARELESSPSGIEVTSIGVPQTVAPPTPSQDGLARIWRLWYRD